MKIELSNGGEVLFDEEDKEFIKGYTWRRLDGGATSYAITKVDGSLVYMHRLIMDTPKGMHTDHINGDGLDNRKENLRVCTPSQHMANRRTATVEPEIEYRGVRKAKRDGILRKPYVARIKKNYKQHHLGYFATPEEAARVYDKKAYEFFGEYARLNFPEDLEAGLDER